VLGDSIDKQREKGERKSGKGETGNGKWEWNNID
jgi:hypothetical protein